MRVPDLDPRVGNNFIDTNALDLTAGPKDGAVREIRRLHDEGAFTLDVSYSVNSEIAHRNTPAGVKRDIAQMVFTIPVELTDPEVAKLEKIRAVIQGNAKPGQHDKDAFHLFESAKYGGRHFITNDGRLLKKAPEIWALLQIKVLNPSDFLAAYVAHAANGPP